MGTGAEEPWTWGAGEGKEALGAWVRGGGGRRIPALVECPGLRRLSVSPANPGDIFRRDQVGAEGCQPQGQLRFPPRPLLLSLLWPFFSWLCRQFLLGRQGPLSSALGHSPPHPPAPALACFLNSLMVLDTRTQTFPLIMSGAMFESPSALTISGI